MTGTAVKPLYGAVCINCGENIYREHEPYEKERVKCAACEVVFIAYELEFEYAGDRWVAECPECEGRMIIPGDKSMSIPGDVECGGCFAVFQSDQLTFEFIEGDE